MVSPSKSCARKSPEPINHRSVVYENKRFTQSVDDSSWRKHASSRSNNFFPRECEPHNKSLPNYPIHSIRNHSLTRAKTMNTTSKRREVQHQNATLRSSGRWLDREPAIRQWCLIETWPAARTHGNAQSTAAFKLKQDSSNDWHEASEWYHNSWLSYPSIRHNFQLRPNRVGPLVIYRRCFECSWTAVAHRESKMTIAVNSSKPRAKVILWNDQSYGYDANYDKECDPDRN